jgi:tricorn protease
VDGGIVSAPEVGTYNENFGWGLGIEQAGVTPDIIVDNDPRETFDGKDRQLEEAINVLRTWLLEEPIAFPRSPGEHHAMTLDKIAEGCSA